MFYLYSNLMIHAVSQDETNLFGIGLIAVPMTCLAKRKLTIFMPWE